MKRIDMLATVLVIVGALNWGLVGFDMDLLATMLGENTPMSKLAYTLVGLGGVYNVLFFKSIRKRWSDTN